MNATMTAARSPIPEHRFYERSSQGSPLAVYALR